MPLTGPDRLEFVPALGRPMRMGSPDQLLVSDADRVREALAGHDLEKLQSYWGYISFGHQIMVSIVYEWALRWRDWAGERASDGLEAFEQSLDPSERAHPLVKMLQHAGSVASLPHAEFNALLPDANAVFISAGQGDWQTASQQFETAYATARELHDVLLRYSWAVMGVLPETLVEEGLTHVLTSCSFYEASWVQGQQLSPLQMAVYMAEHLRLHFSGPQREGSVEIVEEDHCYRLIVDPCGSGGAMRRALRGRPGYKQLVQSSPLTWGQADSVPAYCAHCAVNELESMRRLGHLVWATEFNQDPDQPCGWTIFKSPEQTPRPYLERLS